MTLSFHPFNDESDPFGEDEQRHVRWHDSNLSFERVIRVFGRVFRVVVWLASLGGASLLLKRRRYGADYAGPQ